MRLRTLMVAVAVVASAASMGFSARKVDVGAFVFDSIQPGDWIPLDDTLLTSHGAIMLFDKVVVDDAAKKDYSTIVTIYRRIRIGSAQGRSAADVVVPYYYKDQKVRFISGRTIRHNGDTVLLSPDQVIEKEVLKSEALKIKQVSFSMPGVSDNCIVEFAIRLLLPRPYSLWLIQKDIPMLHGELRWILSTGGAKSTLDFSYFRINWVSNYVWFNMHKPVKVKKLPSDTDLKEFLFTTDSVGAFEHEPDALPENALKGQLRMYYGTADKPFVFWREIEQYIPQEADAFINKSKEIQKAAAQFDSTKNQYEKTVLAYDWVRKRFRNVSYMRDEDPALKAAKYASADEAFKSGFCDRHGINIIFYALLRALNIDAKIVWVKDRDDDLVVSEAKYWQFDRTLIAAMDSTKSWAFYCPGDIYLSAGQTPWNNEGISGLIGNDVGDAFVVVPFSPAAKNRTTRSIRLELTQDMEPNGSIGERMIGHTAAALRYDLHDASEFERAAKIKSTFSKLLPQAEIDSIRIENADSVDLPLRLNLHVQFPTLSANVNGDRLLVKPLDFMEVTANPYTDQKRQNTILRDFAFETAEALDLQIPEGWKLEGVPPDTVYANQTGSCGVRFSAMENSIQVQRVFKLNQAFVSVENYPALQKLYQTLVGLNGLTVSLHRAQQ